MTFDRWISTHTKKKNKVLLKLIGKTDVEIVEYFKWDNMVINEPKYCELYSTKSKCHNVDNLNCLLCGCPFFKVTPEAEQASTGVIEMSSCSINSKYKEIFSFTNDAGRVCTQCDCTNCTVNHTDGFALNSLRADNPDFCNDASSFLEHLRAYQLSEVLGKYKLF